MGKAYGCERRNNYCWKKVKIILGKLKKLYEAVVASTVFINFFLFQYFVTVVICIDTMYMSDHMYV